MDFSGFVGIPFVERGRSREGLDCWGLYALASRELFGRTLPSFADDYVTLEDRAAISDLIACRMGPWGEIEAGTEQPGDALLMSLGGRPMHIGMVVGGGRVLHIDRGGASIIESYRSHRLLRRIVGFYRHA